MCGRWECGFQESPELTLLGFCCKCFIGEFNLWKDTLRVGTVVIPILSKQKLETETQMRELPKVKTRI